MFGHQDVYRLLGRDPIRRPLTELELSLFEHHLLEWWKARHKESQMHDDD